MTEELYVLETSVFEPKLHPELSFRTQKVSWRDHVAGYKRHITYRWCSRLAASGRAGADLAVEYLYGKYIRNLSVSTREQSGSESASKIDPSNEGDYFSSTYETIV